MSSTTILYFLHQLATIFWIGGMLHMHFIFYPALSAVDPGQRNRLVAASAKRFTIAAWCCVLTLAVTGILLTPAGMLFDQSSHYGAWLTIKHVFVATMIVSGLGISFIFAPRLTRFAPKPGEAPSAAFFSAQRGLKVLAGLNMTLGILVVFCITVMKY